MIENELIVFFFMVPRSLVHSSARGVTAGERIIDRSRARDPGMNIVNIPATSVHTRRFTLASYRGLLSKKFGNHYAIVMICP